MKRIVLFIFFAALTTTGLRLGAVPQTDAAGDKLLAAAKHKARDDGDVTTAIAMYKEIAANAGTNRALAAQALQGAAECYETLGKPEAKATYELIVAEYATSGAAATTARTKLAAMGQKGSGLVAKKVFEESGTGYYASYTSVSPDGKYLTFTDWNTGELVIRDLTSGRNKVLTPDAQRTKSYAEEKVFSPDGRFIAYGWENDNGDPYEMRVISRDGGQPRIVSQKEVACCEPWGWSPDGKSILAVTGAAGAGQSKSLVWVPVEGGAIHIIKTFERSAVPPNTIFKVSPDGRFVAFGRRSTAGKPERDVVVLSIETGIEKPLRPHPADDEMLDWFPDGTRLLFSSDRGTAWGIWASRVVDGVSTDDPVLVRPDTGRVQAQGFVRVGAQKGDFYYGVGNSESEVYIATLDSAAGTRPVPLVPLESRFIGNKTQAVWSPNGDRIAYIQRDKLQTLAIKTLSTGDVRLLPLAMMRIQNPVWLGDRGVVVQGTDQARRQGLYLVNVETQALNTIADRDPGGGGSGGGSGAPSRTQPAPSPDGRRVFFVTGRGVVVRDLASGVETDVVTTPGVMRFALSPDSRSLAITQTADDSKHLFVVPASGGEPRILAAAEGWTINGVTWMADSRSLLVVRPGARGPEIWQVPVDGAPPRSTGISWSGTIERISAHPDGRRLAVSTEQVSSETWVLQNIPGPPAKK